MARIPHPEMTPAERVEWIMDRCLGFPATETGPNVTALRELIRKQVTDHGMVSCSAGTWAPECGPAGMYLPHEERAGYLVEFHSAIEDGDYTDMPPIGDSHPQSL